MDRALLDEFDQRIAERGYENRSEALRDLVRADLTKAAWDAGEAVTATWTLLLGKKQREEVAASVDKSAGVSVIARLNVPLGNDELSIIVLKGLARDLTNLAGRVGGMRGVLRSDLVIASIERGSRGEGT